VCAERETLSWERQKEEGKGTTMDVTPQSVRSEGGEERGVIKTF